VQHQVQNACLATGVMVSGLLEWFISGSSACHLPILHNCSIARQRGIRYQLASGSGQSAPDSSSPVFSPRFAVLWSVLAAKKSRRDEP